MKRKPNLTLRSTRSFFNKSGLGLALLPSGLLALFFSVTLIFFIASLSGLFPSGPDLNSGGQLPDYVVFVAFIGSTLPIIFYFIYAGYLASKLTKRQFVDMERGDLTSYFATFKEWLKAFTRSHMLYSIISLLSFVLIFACVYVAGGAKSDMGMPVGLLFVGGFLAVLLNILWWAIFQIFLWLVVTFPLALISSLILRVMCFKRVAGDSVTVPVNPIPFQPTNAPWSF